MDIILETERLYLRKPVIEDIEEYSKYNEREEFYRYIPIDVPNKKSTKEFVKLILDEDNADNKGSYHFVLIEKAENKFLGDVQIHVKPNKEHIAGLGYSINPDYWGRGYVSEALKAVLEFGFKKLKVKRIYAIADKRNIASWRVMEKCGMKYEGCHRGEGFARGEYFDNVYYSILDTDVV